MKKLALMMAVFVCASAPVAKCEADGLALVEDGVSRIPIVVFEDAPPFTRQAADELAEYIEKISGARPEVLEGKPNPMPERAIWVGHQPVLDGLFPNLDFDFEHPEEILIAANDSHLVIAGRDRWNPDHLVVEGKRETVRGVQQEYGTVNAVFTFLQDFLDVRWLWPGEIGEDIVEKRTIAFEPFEHRYHPPLRARDELFQNSLLMRHTGHGHSFDWVRRQRLRLDSLEVSGGHAFKTWWERFHESRPDYFALQPDGTRSGFPGPTVAKLCQSNPDVWRQWLADVEALLEKNPNMTVFNASPNDSWTHGHCVCDQCRAWDHPDGAARRYVWRGVSGDYVALSDRHVRFANECARLLKARYPDRDYYVLTLGYGNSRPAPVEAVPDDNVLISNVANMFWGLDATDRGAIGDPVHHADNYSGWGKATRNQIWRPNTGNPAGWQNGLPDVPIERVMKSFRFVLDHGCVGVLVDTIWENWATQGPLYYVLGLMAWNPEQDWREMFDDYCERGFGPASGELRAYWALLEESRNRKVDEYGAGVRGYAEVYDQAFFDKAHGLLDQAAGKVAGAPRKYRERIEFVRVGLDHTRLCSELRELSRRLVATNGEDEEIAARAEAKWDEMQRNAESVPHAMHWAPLRPGRRMESGGLIHPARLRSGQVKTGALSSIKEMGGSPEPPVGEAPKLQAAEEAGWKMVFADDFERDAIGDTWTVLDGKWAIEDGALRGSGMIVSTKGYPGSDRLGYLRMEFEATSAARSLGADGQPVEGGATRISDMSSLLHARPADGEDAFLGSGYFFQFGGRWNTVNQVSRLGKALAYAKADAARIEPGKRQKVVIENDEGRLRLFVDGNPVLSADEKLSVLGDGRDHVGFYFYTDFKVFSVKVYTKLLRDGLDIE